MGAAIMEKVLLVDDEPQVLLALEDILSDEFIVFKTEAAPEALGILNREPDIAVVITDQRMPRMTGDELLARLGDSSDARRILLTGFADLPAVIRSINEGRIFAYVMKPWNSQDLRLRVAGAAENFRLARELARERQLLRERTSVLDAVLESAADGVVVSDSNGDFLLFNRQAERLLGANWRETTLAEWVKTYGVYLPDMKTALPPEGDPLVLGMSEKTEVEVAIRNRATSKATVVVTASPLRRDARVVGSVALFRDVTERRALEEQLFHAQKMEAIGALAGGVAHDFNNLLSVIDCCANFVLEDLPADDPKRIALDEMLSASKRANVLTRQLLAIGHRGEEESKRLDLNDLVSGTEAMLRRVLQQGVELVLQLAPSLGKIRANEGRIEQILLNLVINARDAMRSGGTLTIETADVPLDDSQRTTSPPIASGHYVVLAVSDTGTGIDPETKKRIFEPFFTTKGPGKGTGLGLSTVYGIVRRSAGHVAVHSELGRGTRFEIFLPRDDEPA